LWRRRTGASVNSAALSACCQACQTRIRSWVAKPSFDRATLVIAASLRRRLWGVGWFRITAEGWRCETSDGRICAPRCAQRLLPGVPDSHTVLGRIATLRSSDLGDCGVPPARTVESGRGAASRITAEGWRCGQTSDGRMCALRCARRLLPGVADSHTALGRKATLHSSDLGDCDVPPVRAVCGVGRGSFASRPRVGVVWRCPTGASVHSAALSACCQAWQTRIRSWVA
jgi:hypothetical protein